MAATQSASKAAPMRAAVLYQAIHLGAAFKDALRENGVDVVYESTADHLDAQRIASEDVQVFVVNLDPELEDYLDQVTDVLDTFDRPVIYNDGNSSSTLAGWDQARWARHLAAKIRGELDAHPARPDGAKSIPMPAAARTSVAAPLATPPVVTAPLATPPVVTAPVAAAPVVPANQPQARAIAPAPVDPFADLDGLLGVLDAGAKATPEPTAPSAIADSLDLDHLLGSMAPQPAVTVNRKTASGVDLDALLGNLAEPTSTAAAASGTGGFETLSFDTLDFSPSPPSAGSSAELTDLDDLFRQLDAKAEGAPVAQAAPAAPAESPTKPAPVATKKEAPTSWSLAPIEGQAAAAPAPAPAPAGRAQFKIDDPLSKPAASTAPAASASKSTAKPVTPPSLDGELPALDFDLGDFMADLAPSAPSQTPPVAARAIPAVVAAPPAPAPAPAASKPARADNFPDLGLSADEFEALGFDTITAPSSAGSSAQDLDPLADLDDIFAELDAPATPVAPARAPAAAVAVPAKSLNDLNRVFVLGASIGGPEAVRSFLAGIKSGIGAGFVLAQHMGAEFIELMAAQLDKASPVRVRVPIDGERFRHGEVMVVPVGKRLTLDASGHVVMGAPPVESPYSPSIDQVLMDMADRFGARCTAIIFSGMASDAVEGCKYLHSRGGQIWVQDPNTCVISSMIDGAQAAGIVSFVGSPEALAQKLLKEVL